VSLDARPRRWKQGKPTGRVDFDSRLPDGVA
jgi:hypothetical protein